MIGNNTIHIKSIGSTNSYLKNLISEKFVQEGTLVCAKKQHDGRGQRGNIWLTESNKNLTFSFVVYPKFLHAEKQFLLSKITALSVAEFLKKHLKVVKIKWPNDIYINDLKVAGILIENTLSGSNIASSVIGIGLNVNQTNFDKSLPNPTSMKLQTGSSFDLDLMLQDLCVHLNFWYAELQKNNIEKIDINYTNSLYKYKEESWFKDKNGKFKAAIQGVDKIGQLRLIDSTGNIRLYAFKEVAFCL